MTAFHGWAEEGDRERPGDQYVGAGLGDEERDEEADPE
jgi:hypothetical protein